MTKTALRALTVIALLAAIVLAVFTDRARADTAQPPVLVPPIVTDTQLPEPDPTDGEQQDWESSGGARCADPADTMPCDEPAPVPAPVSTSPAPAPAAVPTAAVTTGSAPASTQAAAAAAAAATASTVPTASVQPLGWVVLDRVWQILRTLVPWALPSVG